MTNTLPVTVLGGYLGAGKTTLINAMLRRANGLRLAVLVNEFGALPIDADLIEAEEDDLIALAGGCVCCSFGSDLAGALDTLASRTPRPDHVIIEASGVALPAGIAGTIDLLPAYSIAGISVLADAAHIRAQAADDYIGDTIERQLTQADLIIVTKSDLVSVDAKSALETWLAASWPGAAHVTAENGALPLPVLLGQFETKQADAEDAHHDATYTSLSLGPDHPMDARALATALTAPALGVIRAKGHVTDRSGIPHLIQIVGPRAEVTPAPGAHPGLVVIGLAGKLDARAVTTLAQGG